MTEKTAKKPRAPRKVKTAAEILKEIEATKAKLAKLEQQAYGSAVEEAVKATGFVEQFKKLLADNKGVSDIALLATYGKVAGIKRLSITQTERKPRVPKNKTEAAG